uniref:Sodium/hydrogen exchanger n=1 Tax=Eutreptiella gymnastica TaxID=73025 RepID=A0A7S1J2B7_9EUGL
MPSRPLLAMAVCLMLHILPLCVSAQGLAPALSPDDEAPELVPMPTGAQTKFVPLLFGLNVTDLDPLEGFFKWLATNSSTDACRVIRNSYLRVCNVPEVLGKLCDDFLAAYQTRCEHETQLFSCISLVSVMSVLVACFLTGNLLEVWHWTWLPHSGVSILIGFFAGAALKASVSAKGLEDFQFDESIFFLVFLPYIVFEAGLTIDKGMLWRHLGPIGAFAIVGTFISIFGIGYSLSWAGDVLGYNLPLVECLLFGSLISSIDPIATLSLFQHFGVDRDLYILVLGESILNDGVSVVMYDTFLQLLDVPFNGLDTLADSLQRFAVVFFGSILVGLLFGLTSALLFKYGQLQGNPTMETILFIVVAAFPYYACEHLQWSGIVAILVESVVMDLYTYQSLSTEAQLNTKFTIKCVAHLLEQCIFAYLGMQVCLAAENLDWNPAMIVAAIGSCLVCRGWVFPVAWLVNRTRPAGEEVPPRNQVMVWFSGLRGAVSFALAMKIPRYDELLKKGSEHVSEILAMTTAVVMYKVFIHGGLTAVVLRRLNIPTGCDQAPYTHPPLEETGPLLRLHRLLLPVFTKDQRSSRAVEYWSLPNRSIDVGEDGTF